MTVPPSSSPSGSAPRGRDGEAPVPRPGGGRHLVVGVSGASGMPYAQDLLARLIGQTAYQVHLVFSPSALFVMERECGEVRRRGHEVDVADFARLGGEAADEAAARVVQYRPRDVGARLASGSFLHDGMVVCPASVKTMGALSVGMTDNLLLRAADVTLKERRRLVLVPRETPLSLIHLRTMTALAEAGGVILPAMPGFYHRPRTIEDVTRFLSMKIFDVLGIPFDTGDRWDPPEEPEAPEAPATPTDASA